MNINFYNCPNTQEIEVSLLPKEVEFLTCEPDFSLIDSLVKAYGDYKNILIVGNGGSINPFLSIYLPLKNDSKKEVYVLNTIDPDYIYELKQKLKPIDTLVLSISKSGENIQQIEATLQFSDFPMVVITGKSGALRAVAEKLKHKILTHSQVGGRYTAFTESALLPLALCGFDYKQIFNFGRNYHNLFYKNNPAFQTANIFWQLEKKGYIDVLMVFYSHYLLGASNAAIQLFHESFGKAGKGQTYFAHEGPEVQHHTTQRFFGGQKNICGMFFTLEDFSHPTLSIYPPSLHNVKIKNRLLLDLDKIPLEKALGYEWAANVDSARIQGIPTAHFSLTGLNAQAVGELGAFWQLFAVYSACLRGVNPFDQPEVEGSKNMAFQKRLDFKGHK